MRDLSGDHWNQGSFSDTVSDIAGAEVGHVCQFIQCWSRVAKISGVLAEEFVPT